MASKGLGWTLSAGLWAGLLLAGCHGHETAGLPELSDPPLVQAPQWRSLAVQVTAYGLAVLERSQLAFEVSVAKGEAVDLREGQNANVEAGGTRLECRVERILREASDETGESLVWLKPLAGAPAVQVGDFALAKIATRQLGRACAVPAKAIFIRGGQSLVVLRRGSGSDISYETLTVTTGATDGEWIQIPFGLKATDQVVSQGGLGFLYPDFKSQGDD